MRHCLQRRPRRIFRSNQPDLFCPPPERPTWKDLPMNTQQQVRLLLARMLQSASAGLAPHAKQKEVSDE